MSPIKNHDAANYRDIDTPPNPLNKWIKTQWKLQTTANAIRIQLFFSFLPVIGSSICQSRLDGGCINEGKN